MHLLAFSFSYSHPFLFSSNLFRKYPHPSTHISTYYPHMYPYEKYSYPPFLLNNCIFSLKSSFPGQGNFNSGRSFFHLNTSPIELNIHLDTGRHHQIRVQLAALGCPILGDSKYNPQPVENGTWQTTCLCAYRLDFHHPKTQKPLHFELEQDDC